MLLDNLELQESVIHDVRDRANEVLGVFPEADGDKARTKLLELDNRFLLIKKRLHRRLEEMMKSSIDWHEFECGLKSCLDWVQRAEDRLLRHLRENEGDISRLEVGNETIIFFFVF